MMRTRMLRSKAILLQLLLSLMWLNSAPVTSQSALEEDSYGTEAGRKPSGCIDFDDRAQWRHD